MPSHNGNAETPCTGRIYSNFIPSPLVDSSSADNAERPVRDQITRGDQSPNMDSGGGAVSIIALVCSPDGDHTVRAGGEGPIEHAAVVGEETAERALRDGADRILEEIRDA